MFSLPPWLKYCLCLVFPLPSWLKHRLVLPLPSWLRYSLCLVLPLPPWLKHCLFYAVPQVAGRIGSRPESIPQMFFYLQMGLYFAKVKTLEQSNDVRAFLALALEQVLVLVLFLRMAILLLGALFLSFECQGLIGFVHWRARGLLAKDEPRGAPSQTLQLQRADANRRLGLLQMIAEKIENIEALVNIAPPSPSPNGTATAEQPGRRYR